MNSSTDQNLLCKELPAALEAEQGLIGALMIHNGVLDLVSDILKPEHFYEPIHKRIYEICLEASQNGRTFSPITVSQGFSSVQKIGEMTMSQYIARTAAEAVTLINAREYALVIIETFVARSAINEMLFATEGLYECHTPEATKDAMDRVTDLFAELRSNIDNAPDASASSWLDRMNPDAVDTKPIGVPIQFEELQRVLSEPVLEVGNLYGLLSSSGEGKTSFVLQMIYHALKCGHPVVVLSFDQSKDQIFAQMAAQVLSIEVVRQKERRVSRDEFADCENFDRGLRKMPIDIIKCTNQTAGQLCTLARKSLKRFQRTNDNPALIVVDHIGAIRSENDRVDPGTQAAAKNRPLKSFAVETGSAVVVLNQRNSDGMKRTNPRPVAGDLYGGDRARNDYDAVFWVYRHRKWFDEKVAVAASINEHKTIAGVFPSAYFDEPSGQAKMDDDIAEIGALKVRFGDPSIKKQMNFVARFTRYVPIAQGQGGLF